MKVGWYLCGILEWGARDQSEKEGGSLAVSVSLKMKTHALWNEKLKAWERVEEEEDVFGDYYVIKKDGQFNPIAVEQLAEAGLWDTSKLFARFDEPVPEGLEIGVSMEQDDYEGKKRWRANWIIHAEATPGARGIANKASKEKLLALNAKYGAGLRAITPKKKAPEPAPWDGAQVAEVAVIASTDVAVISSAELATLITAPVTNPVNPDSPY